MFFSVRPARRVFTTAFLRLTHAGLGDQLTALLQLAAVGALYRLRLGHRLLQQCGFFGGGIHAFLPA